MGADDSIKAAKVVDDPAIADLAVSVMESFGVDGAKRLLQRVTAASESTGGGIRFRSIRKRGASHNQQQQQQTQQQCGVDASASAAESAAIGSKLVGRRRKKVQCAGNGEEKEKEKEKVAQKEKEKDREKIEIDREIEKEIDIERNKNKNIYINNNYNNTISPEISESESLSINSDIRKEKQQINSDAVSKSLRDRYMRFLADAMCDEGLAIEVRLRAGQELSKLLGWAGMGDDEIRRVADADPALWVQAIDLAVTWLGVGGTRYSAIARALTSDYLGVKSSGGGVGVGASTSTSAGVDGGVRESVDPVEYLHGGSGRDSAV